MSAPQDNFGVSTMSSASDGRAFLGTPLLLTTLLGIYVIQSTICMFTFQGLPAIFRAEGISTANIGLLSLIMLPWALKFLWAPQVERYRKVGQSSRLYISYTRGYRPGGFNRAVAATTDSKAFDAEKSDNFELGWRCQCADGRLLIDAALYKVDIEDIQLYVGNIGSQSIQNLGEAESEGLEFSMSYQGSNNIDFNLGGTFGESRFTNSVDTVTNTTYTGNHLPYAPDETVVAGVSYTLPQVGKGNLIFSVNSNYYADTFFNETNTLSQDSYSLVDASISYQIDDFNLKFYAKNIEDKEYRTYSFQQGANVLSNYGDGRIVGVNLSTGF